MYRTHFDKPEAKPISLPIFIWSGWVALALLLSFGPTGISQLVESLTLRVAGFGLRAIDSVSGDSSTIDREVPQQLAELQAANRALTLQVATLRDQLSREQTIPDIPISEPESLVKSQALIARVLGAKTSMQQQSSELLISLGKKHGLLGEELVLSGEGVLIDAGSAKGLATDQLVQLGAALFGRTRAVGPLTTLVQPLTDPEFQIGVRLVRQSPLGPVWGATGILVGTGEGCEVKEVVATEPVAVGDFLYTHPNLSTNSQMIYCGKVSSVSLGDSDTHWTIQVTPAATPHALPAMLNVINSELILQ